MEGSATPSSVLRELYEALARLDESQRTGGISGRLAPRVVDLRDSPQIIAAGTLRHSVRTSIGPDWDLDDHRW